MSSTVKQPESNGFSSGTPATPNLEAMFAQIMSVVQKSVWRCPMVSHFCPFDPLTSTCIVAMVQSAEIAELRQESAELKQANRELQLQVREGLKASISLQTPNKVCPFLHQEPRRGTR